MPQYDDKIRALSDYRMELAEECLFMADMAYESGKYRSAANRAYYAVFNAIRAVLGTSVHKDKLENPHQIRLYGTDKRILH